MASAGKSLLRMPDKTRMAYRLARSACAVDNAANSLNEIREWIAERQASQVHQVDRIPFDDLVRWEFGQHCGEWLPGAWHTARLVNEVRAIATTVPVKGGAGN